MTLKDNEKELLYEVLQEVKPYLAEIRSVEELIDKHLESANSILEFVAQLESENNTAKNSIIRTDLRIYVAKLRKRTRR
nr:hypothetical protein [Candidatus Njordarchaeum guaymaensis]